MVWIEKLDWMAPKCKYAPRPPPPPRPFRKWRRLQVDGAEASLGAGDRTEAGADAHAGAENHTEAGAEASAGSEDRTEAGAGASAGATAGTWTGSGAGAAADAGAGAWAGASSGAGAGAGTEGEGAVVFLAEGEADEELQVLAQIKRSLLARLVAHEEGHGEELLPLDLHLLESFFNV